ncbi:MAG TPA: nucleoside 2-deoxyribosyltransferase [Candidatus Thermoplasmatota archaeon]|nr:nucleoside 2-deoxyribosyltransferase [Candidatus Thermoplasmatota archaeon]
MPRPIFLAAPESGQGALGLVDKLLAGLEVASDGAWKAGDVFVPHLQVGDAGIEVTPAAWFERTLTALQEARVVVAVLDGPQVDENVAFLLGYAFAAQKPVVAYATDGRAKGPLTGGAARATAIDLRGLVKELRKALG